MVKRALLVTTESDLSADLVVSHLMRRGVPFLRFNQEDFPAQVSVVWPGDCEEATITVRGDIVRFAQIHSAWFRNPVSGRSTGLAHRTAIDFAERERTGCLSGLWESSPWFWMNRPSSVAHAKNKLLQLTMAKRLGFRIPKSLATNCIDTAREFVRSRAAISKPITGGGLSAQETIFTTKVEAHHLYDEALGAGPAMFQERIQRGFDLRVTVVGQNIFAAKIIVRDAPEEVDWRALSPGEVYYETCSIPQSLAGLCHDLMRGLSLTYGALDFMVTPAGEYVLLEINPSGQWGWIEEATGLEITSAIVDLLVEGEDRHV